MDKSGAIFHWAFLGILLPLASAENIKESRSNVNLSPFQVAKHRRMHDERFCCLLNQNTLTLDGTIDVPQTEVDDYCNKGCSQHTIDILNFIHYVKRDFWFSNKATVRTLHDLINDGCSSRTAITTVNWKSSAAAGSPGMAMAAALVLALVSLAFLILLEMQAYH